MKKTYLYHVLIGNNNNGNIETFIDEFAYARNAKVLKEFCKELYKKEKYNHYQMIKVGLSHTLQETQILQPDEAARLRNTIASKSDKYSEREIEAPKFITKEEAGELGL